MAYEVIYNATDLTIERETVPSSGSGTEEDPFIYPERRTIRVRPEPPSYVTTISDDVNAQRILDRAQNFRDLATVIENAPASTAGNILGQFDALKEELPDLFRAVAWIGERYVGKS